MAHYAIAQIHCPWQAGGYAIGLFVNTCGKTTCAPYHHAQYEGEDKQVAGILPHTYYLLHELYTSKASQQSAYQSFIAIKI